MSDNYAVINGKRIKLTKEQVEALGIKRKNPFERVAKDDVYYTVLSSGSVGRMEDYLDCQDDSQYDAANYFNDEAFANQVALHQLLYRKLLKFAYDNDCEDNQAWNKTNYHYYIYYNTDEGRFCTDATRIFKHNDVWFCSRDLANRAIKEVVKPFVKKHPDFVL